MSINTIDEDISLKLKESLEIIERVMGVSVNSGLLEEYLWGVHPDLLVYDPFKNKKYNLTALDRYLIGAYSFLKWGERYYNIFDIGRMCRFVLISIRLGESIQKHTAHRSENVELIYKRIKTSKNFHDFEAAFYELLVSSRYLGNNVSVKFIPEGGSKKTPDFQVDNYRGDTFYVECKKQIRINNLSSRMREEVRTKCFDVLRAVIESGDSLLAEITFFVNPENVPSGMIASALGHCKNNKLNYHRNPCFSVNIKWLEKYDCNGYPVIATSPQFLKERYDYSEDDEWMGFVNSGKFQPAYMKDCPFDTKHLFTNWVLDIENDCGIKWRVVNEDILYKLRRVSLDKTFEALNQLKTMGKNSIVHYWIESEEGHGCRSAEFREYLEKLSKSDDDFKYIIINETIWNVTPKNHVLDLIEHGHYILGSESRYEFPKIINVFTEGQIADGDHFGKGAKLSDIDP